MADLTDNELRAVAYFSIGVSSEGKNVSYRLAFAGNTVRDAAGNVNLQPAGYSGYTVNAGRRYRYRPDVQIPSQLIPRGLMLVLDPRPVERCRLSVTENWSA
jgi:hypothetical protein